MFTEKEAEDCLPYLKPIAFHEENTLDCGLKLTFYRAGHILGSASIAVTDGTKTVLFSGDIGRPFDPLLKATEKPKNADIVVIESTYGDRLHEEENPVEKLKTLIDEVVSKNGILLIPAFAVGRTQSLLYYFYQLKKEKMIPNIPIYVDSPMAINATRLLTRYPDEHSLPAQMCKDIFDSVNYVKSAEDSIALNSLTKSAVIISASGMATGGRVLHHLKRLLPDPKNTILLAGYQAGGTRGDRLLRGESIIKIHGEMVPVHAKIALLSSLSAHGDYAELLDWFSQLKKSA